MMTYKCKNPECGKTFEIPARISSEKTSNTPYSEWKRIIVEKPCCPFCECLAFEEVKTEREKEFDFRLQALSNFVFSHFHRDGEGKKTSEAKVVVKYPNEEKEEPSDKIGHETQNTA